MLKKKMIHLHWILTEIKKWLEESGVANNGSFTKYNELNISPQQLSKTIEEHKEAVKILSEELAQCTRQV